MPPGAPLRTVGDRRAVADHSDVEPILDARYLGRDMSWLKRR
jgi:hypothetical protein